MVDEAQRIKNRETLTAESVNSLRTRYCFALTSTPVENRASDLHSIMDLVDPTILGPFWQFDHDDVLNIRSAVRPAILRRRRSILADQLPTRRDERRVVRITEEQLGFRRLKVSAAAQVMAEARRQNRKLTPGENALIMSYLTSARMASNGMFLIDGETMESAKVDELTRVIEELRAEGRKVVIFSEWVRMIEFVRERLNKQGVGSFFLHGSVPGSRRSDLIDQFAKSPDGHLFFSTEAGGVDRDVRIIDIVGTGYELSGIGHKLARKREVADSILEPNSTVAKQRPTPKQLAYSALRFLDPAG